MLDSRERAIRSLCLEEPDRVPLFDLSIDFPIIRDITGKEITLTKENMEKDLSIIAECHKKIGLDFLVYYGGYGIVDERELKYIDDKTFIDPWGAIRRKMDFPTLEAIYMGGSIKNPMDLERFQPPDVEKTIELIKSVEKTLRKIGEEMLLVGGIVGCFITGLEMRGFVNWLSDFYLNPSLAKKILDMVHEFNIEVGSALVDAGAEAIIYDDDYADAKGPMLCPKLWREFIKPYHSEFVRKFKKKGVFVLEHSDGNIMSIIDDLIESELDALHPIEPGAMDMSLVKERYGDKICLIGNVDCKNIMVRGSEDDVRRDVRRCIDQASPGGGHILSASNSLNWQIPTKNVLAMVDEAKRYGKYPFRF